MKTNKLYNLSKQTVLNNSTKETTVMTAAAESVVLNGEPLEEDFTYLRSTLSKDNGPGKDVKVRLKQSHHLLHFIPSGNNYNLRTKLKLNNILPVLSRKWACY